MTTRTKKAQDKAADLAQWMILDAAIDGDVAAEALLTPGQADMLVDIRAGKVTRAMLSGAK